MRFHEIFLKLVIKVYKCYVRRFFLHVANDIFYVRLASKVLQNLPPKNDKMLVPYNECSLTPDCCKSIKLGIFLQLLLS